MSHAHGSNAPKRAWPSFNSFRGWQEVGRGLRLFAGASHVGVGAGVHGDDLPLLNEERDLDNGARLKGCGLASTCRRSMEEPSASAFRAQVPWEPGNKPGIRQRL